MGIILVILGTGHLWIKDTESKGFRNKKLGSERDTFSTLSSVIGKGRPIK
jgi:hypothetical protein